MEYLKNVVTLRIETDKCTGCSVCTSVCPRNVLKVIDRKAVIINRDSCIECGACVNNCLFEAISVKAGVGCAAAMINGLIKTGDPSKGSCGCSKEGCC
jgi:NAD-dependent dihydropyrimidine dehydrogenase PreA subunit